MVIGIGGLYCSGKSTVARILIDAGYREVDVDSLGHRALADRRDEIVARFGDEILNADGSIDRGALGARVFGDAEARRTLERIVHPHMVDTAAAMIDEAQGEPVALHAALLFPMRLDRLCDVVIWVSAPLLTRICRGLQRDSGNLRRVLGIIRAQRKLGVQPQTDSVDIHTVENRGHRDQLIDQLRRINLPRI